jgi:hypothetical protein
MSPGAPLPSLSPISLDGKHPARLAEVTGQIAFLRGLGPGHGCRTGDGHGCPTDDGAGHSLEEPRLTIELRNQVSPGPRGHALLLPAGPAAASASAGRHPSVRGAAADAIFSQALAGRPPLPRPLGGRGGELRPVTSRPAVAPAGAAAGSFSSGDPRPRLAPPSGSALHRPCRRLNPTLGPAPTADALSFPLPTTADQLIP